MSLRSPLARRRLGFESLESRALPAGNVTAAVVAGSLQITGDDVSNSISISQIDADSFRITSMSTGGAFSPGVTKINGTKGAKRFDGVTGDITFNMLGGNDFVSLIKVSLPHDLQGTMGIGNDLVRLNNVTVAHDLIMDMEGGADTFFMAPVTSLKGGVIHGQVVVSGSSGDDTLTVGYTTASNNLQLNGDSGNDKVTVYNSAVTGSLLIDSGTENDTVTVESNTAAILSITLGDGINSASLTSGTYGVATITGGINEDTVSVHSLTVAGDLTIDTVEKADTVTIDRSVADRFVVHVGDDQRHLGNVVSVTQSNANWGIFTCTGLRDNSLTIDSLSQIQAIIESGFQIVNI